MHKPAIDHAGAITSYAALLNGANAVTSFLLHQCLLQKETIVGIQLDDRRDLICAMIGVMNARCVVVPLDSTLPASRLRAIMENLNLEHVITSRHVSLTLHGDEKLNVKYHYMEEIGTTIGGLNAGGELHYPEYEGDDSLYIYFTSGSTGVPKGIVGRNSSLLQFMTWEIAAFNIPEGYRFSQFVSPYFDAFLRDIFVPLFSGGTICIPPHDLIAPWIDEARVNFIHCVPSLFRIVNNDTLSPENFKHLQYVLMSGEKITPSELKNWYHVFGERIQLVNLYGATETTLIRAFYRISAADVNQSRIPIGAPIADTELLIANADLKPCSVLVTGELYIVSDYVSKGYLNSPELTQEKFVKIRTESGQLRTAFKTGDKARKLANGTVDLIGRDDRQVKVRGIRIELDEIETVLMQAEVYRSAVVIKHTDENQNESLIAFVVSKQTDQDASMLKAHGVEFLSRHLPSYMLPAELVVLNELPLLPNGKVNYKGLTHLMPAERPIVLPANVVEERLLGIWQEILGDKTVSTDENFNKVGGNSLSMMNLISKINRDFKVKFSLRQLFENLTIRSQAGFIARASQNSLESITAAAKKAYYALSPAQKSMYFLHELNRASLAYNMPQLVKLSGVLQPDTLKMAFDKLVKRHEGLRTSFHVVDGEPLQKIHDPVDFEIEYFNTKAEEVQAIISRFIRPFDLEAGLLMRVGVIQIALEEHILMVDMHHIISDGSSQSILIRDFMGLYNQQTLPALKLTYKDFAEWSQDPARQVSVSKQRSFWVGEFSKKFESVELPYDFKRPSIKTYSGNIVEAEVPAILTGKLRAVVERENVTMFMVVASIYTILLSKLSHQEDIVIGSSMTGRHHPDLENMIGMFVNTLPLRCHPQRHLSFNSFLASVKSKVLLSLENQDYPYEELVDALRDKRDASRNPLFDVLLAYQNFAVTELRIPGLTLTSFDRDHTEAKFDITLFAFEHDDKIMLKVEYATSLFKKETIERFIGSFIKIAETIAAGQDIILSDIEIVNGQDQDMLNKDQGRCFKEAKVENDTETPLGNPVEASVAEVSVEDKLVQIWSDVLKIDKNQISLTDSFAALGGNSLRVLALINKIYRELGVNVPLKVVFERRNIRGLTEYVLGAGKTGFSSITPAAVKERYAQSSAQKAVYFHYEMDRSSMLYNQPRIVRIEGALDKAKLERAFNVLIERHEILRTSFEFSEDQPVQRISRELDFQIEYFSADEKEVRSVLEKAIRPFDMTKPPLLRAVLVEVSSLDFFLMVDFHHIVADGISDGIVVRELAALYNNERLPVVKLQYKDYSEWQISAKRQAALEKMKQFWIDQFPGEVPVLELPADFTESSEICNSGGSSDFVLNAEATSRLKAIANAEGASTFMMLLAIYNVLLSKLSQQDDIVVGTLVSGRDHVDVEKMVGMFVKDLALRNYPKADLTFVEFLKEVRAVSLGCFENQACHYSAAGVQFNSGNRERTPYNAFFLFPNFDRSEPVDVPGLTFSTHNMGGVEELRYDITLIASEDGENGVISLRLCCNKLFRSETRDRFVNYFTTIADEILKDPHIMLCDIDIVTAAERKQIFSDFNKSYRDIDLSRSFTSYFNEQLERTPLNIAIEHNGVALTYVALGERVDQLSSYLRALGIGANQRVGLLVPRGIDFLISMLAVFKSGGTYVPLDVAYPSERIKEILNDSEAEVVIAVQETADVVGHLKDDVPLVKQWIDARQFPETQSGDVSEPDQKTDDLAYIIYTSGTTGKPKGVMIHQLGMINHLYAKVNALALKESDIIAQTASTCFDISVWQFLSALLVGAKTLVIDQEIVLEPQELVKELQDKEVTVFQTVPSILTAFLEGIDADFDNALPNLRWMIPTGEQLSVSLVEKWYSAFPDIQLLNAYGPTEASDDITHHVVGQPFPGQVIVPVGRPVQNTHIYILDAYSNLCPVGVKGEICVAGLGVGKGYWKNGEKTKHAFVDNPFIGSLANNLHYDMLFKTGDIGYFTPEGEVICLGRLDEQVKIRGLRIEPGEIEHILLQYESVRDAVVLTYDGNNNDRRLVAFITQASQASISTIREFLKSRLPDYMVPSSIIKVDRMPLTINGKVDKKSLLKKISELDLIHENHVDPETEIQRQLVELWQEVLGIEKVGITNNFFELGGNSLRVITLTKKISKLFNVELSIKEFFTKPTVTEVAENIESKLWLRNGESVRDANRQEIII